MSGGSAICGLVSSNWLRSMRRRFNSSIRRSIQSPFTQVDQIQHRRFSHQVRFPVDVDADFTHFPTIPFGDLVNQINHAGFVSHHRLWFHFGVNETEFAVAVNDFADVTAEYGAVEHVAWLQLQSRADRLFGDELVAYDFDVVDLESHSFVDDIGHRDPLAAVVILQFRRPTVAVKNPKL